MAFELKRFGIGIKTIAPGGIATDFAGRSLDHAPGEAYDGLMSKVWKAFAGMFTHSTPEQIAAVIYEAATDGKDQLRYLAGEDAALPPAVPHPSMLASHKKRNPALPGSKVKNFLM